MLLAPSWDIVQTVIGAALFASYVIASHLVWSH